MRIDEVEGVAVAEEQSVAQNVRVEQQVQAAVLHDLSEQLAELKKAEAVAEQMHDHVHVDVDEEQHASEPVSVDAAGKLRLVEDLNKICTRVDGISEAAREVIDRVRETDRFFSENALQEMRDRLPLQMQDREMERQHQDNVERTLVQNFAVNQETTIDEVTANRQAMQEQYNDVAARLQQDPPLAERFELEAQSVALCNNIDYYQSLERVAAQAAYAEQCAAAQRELEKQGLAAPVLLNAEGVPVQRFGANPIGPAYATQEQAEREQQAQYERRLAEANTEAQRENVKAPHVLQVEIRDQQENVIQRWWEVSELGQRASEGHTEQKAINRIDLDAMREKDYQLYMAGLNPPCAWPAGCANMLEVLHDQYDVDIVYNARGSIYTYTD